MDIPVGFTAIPTIPKIRIGQYLKDHPTDRK